MADGDQRDDAGPVTAGPVTAGAAPPAAAAVPRAALRRLAAALGTTPADVVATDVAVLGRRHEERLRDAGDRRRAGAWYTPPAVVEAVLDTALAPVLADRTAGGPAALAAVRVVDPACGAGAFLGAAVARIAGALETCGVAPGAARRLAAETCVGGIDVDPVAADLARLALVRAGGRWAAVVRRVVTADALLAPDWGARLGSPIDVVVGNPPFRNRLRRRAAPDAAHAAALAAALGDVAGPYTDVATLFCVAAARAVRPDGGVVALVLPTSFLTARDAAPARAAVAAVATLRAVAAVPERSFDAAVQACVAVLDRPAGPPGPAGAGDPVGRGHPAPAWADRAPRAAALPHRSPVRGGVLADVATATADFRDQYYGLAGAVVDRADADDREWPPLLTTGLVDLARSRWGERPATVHRTRYLHPRVDLARLDDRMRRWASARLVPKVLVATQTRVLECVVDEAGVLLPSVPLVTVVPTSVSAWHVAAVLASPAVTLEAARRHLGAGLSADALKLAAREVLALPVPPPGPDWDAAAAAVRRAHDPTLGDDERDDALRAAARSTVAAFGLGDDPALLAWWDDRRRSRRRAPGGVRP